MEALKQFDLFIFNGIQFLRFDAMLMEELPYQLAMAVPMISAETDQDHVFAGH